MGIMGVVDGRAPTLPLSRHRAKAAKRDIGHDVALCRRIHASSSMTDDSDRLDSWKEIAAYLKRDVRTVQRWEKHAGLPVHRIGTAKLGRVYASKAALDTWLAAGRGNSVD